MIVRVLEYGVLRKINVKPTKFTRKNLKGESYTVYKAVDLSNSEKIPVPLPKSLPLLKNFLSGLIDKIIKRNSKDKNIKENSYDSENKGL